MSQQKLIKGIAYHGNRMLRHVETDLREIVNNGFNLVVHMFSHTDWDRHKNVMKEVIQMTHDHGLDVWVDNWGLAGPPGDKTFFLGFSPESRQMYSDGSIDPVRVCLNSPEFRAFTKEWIDTVHEIGGKKIFWDEPHLNAKEVQTDGMLKDWSCYCNRCQTLYEERYNEQMPTLYTPNVAAFRVASITSYFEEVTNYSKAKMMENIVCVMLGSHFGINLDNIHELGNIEALDNIGSDPYWLGQGDHVDVYDYVYQATKQNLEVCERFNKDHNLWIQGYAFNEPGREQDIILATDAAYDAGARTILVWGYRGSESNDYGAKYPDLTWNATGHAMRRITDRHMDELRAKGLTKVSASS